jgi:hypothetical protein
MTGVFEVYERITYGTMAFIELLAIVSGAVVGESVYRFWKYHQKAKRPGTK